MRVLSRGLACLGLAALLAPPLCGAAEYIRDEVRINLRAGPGQEFRVLRLLRSGTELARLGADDGWVRVSVSDGQEGWVPQAYVTAEVPPSVALPRIVAKLDVAKGRIGDLRTQGGGGGPGRADRAENPTGVGAVWVPFGVLVPSWLHPVAALCLSSPVPEG